MKKRIAILTLSVGSGHLRASNVIREACGDSHEAPEVRVMDALDTARTWFHWVYVQSYWWMLRQQPHLWRRLYERRQLKRHHATAPEWVFRRGCAPLLRELKSFDPHLIIATEIGAAEIAALSRREGVTSAPILAVLTDFHSEPPWVQPEIDFYCVASDAARRQLIQWGVSSHRILNSGIPIDPVFSMPLAKAEAARSLGLSAARPVVLVMAGGMGPAPLHEITEQLEYCKLPLQVVAVAGRDRVAKARLDALRGRLALDLFTFGWCDRVPELMAASDLLITKPGGLTVSEALAAGLPMLLTHPIPGPEERNLQFLVESGVAVRAKKLEDISDLTFELLADSPRRKEMAQKARDMARPDAGHAIAQVARALLDKAAYIDLLAMPPVHSGETAYLM